MQLEVGKFYRTRKGEKVFIYCLDVHEETFPFHGVKVGKIRNSHMDCWREDGRFENGAVERVEDIIGPWETDGRPSDESPKQDGGERPVLDERVTLHALATALATVQGIFKQYIEAVSGGDP